jgi:hypothetical protein
MLCILPLVGHVLPLLAVARPMAVPLDALGLQALWHAEPANAVLEGSLTAVLETYTRPAFPEHHLTPFVNLIFQLCGSTSNDPERCRRLLIEGPFGRDGLWANRHPRWLSVGFVHRLLASANVPQRLLSLWVQQRLPLFFLRHADPCPFTPVALLEMRRVQRALARQVSLDLEIWRGLPSLAILSKSSTDALLGMQPRDWAHSGHLTSLTEAQHVLFCRAVLSISRTLLVLQDLPPDSSMDASGTSSSCGLSVLVPAHVLSALLLLELAMQRLHASFRPSILDLSAERPLEDLLRIMCDRLTIVLECLQVTGLYKLQMLAYAAILSDALLIQSSASSSSPYTSPSSSSLESIRHHARRLWDLVVISYHAMR